MIFSLFLLFSPLVFSSATTIITVCQGECPSHSKGQTISYYSSDDLSDKLDDYMAAENEIYFFTYSEQFTFTFSLNIFDGHHVELKKLDLSNHVNLGIDCNKGPSAGDVTFINIDVELSNILQADFVEFDALTLINTDIDLHKISPTLRVGSLNTDQSIISFKNVIITKSLTQTTGVTLDMTTSKDASIVLKDFGFSTHIDTSTINPTTSFTFENAGYTTTNFKIDGNKLYTVSYQASSASKIPSTTFTNFEKLNFTGTWPEDARVHISDKFSSKRTVLITAGGSVLPISYTGYNATIVLSQNSTVISGDCSGMLKFSHINNKFSTRTAVNMKGEYTGNEIDLGSGFVDLTVKKISGDFTYGDFPFVFRVGVGGASTAKVESCSVDETKKTGVKVYPDFYNYLRDSELKTLLSKEWNILTMTGVTFSISFIHIILQNEYFVHGFQDKDSCVSVTQKSNTLVLTASAPSLLPLNICFDGDDQGGDCGLDDGVEIRDIGQLTTYFEDGMKYLNLTIKRNSLNDLDFTAFDYGYSDVKVNILGFGTTVEQISFAQGGAIVEISFDNLLIGKSDFYIKKVKFSNCKCQPYSEFVFHSNEIIIGDDAFIKLFASKISPTYPIKNLTYIMDHYDAIDVKKDEYIFYDIDRNDISEPIHLRSEVLEHLFIIYDVGITPTADRNNLNVTMSTSNPPSFDITFSPITPGYWTEAELILYSWKQTENSTFVVNFDHDILNVVVVLTEPHQPKQLKVTGTGNVRYVNRYSDDDIFCATSDGTSTGCPQFSNPFTYSGLLKELQSSTKNNITVYIGRSTSDKHPAIELYMVDRKVFTFIGLSENAKDIIEFSSHDSDGVDIKTTTTSFQNLNVICGSQSTVFTFGELKFTDCTIDSSFKNAAIQVDDFYCEYKILSFFKSVSITDNCYVSGEYSTVASEVKFAEDDNSGDLQATLSDDAKLEMGDEYVKIGATTFKFSSVELVYDVVLFVSPKKTVDVTKASGASENLMPVVRVDTCVDTTFNFLGKWEECDKTQIFLFNQVDELKIGLASEHVPISLSSDEGDFLIVAKAETVGISGHIEYRQISKVNIVTVKYETVSKAKITIDGQFNIGGGIIFKFSQSNIELVVSEIAGSKSDSAVIQSEHYSDLKGDSLLTIQKAMINSVLSQDYKVQIPINVAIDDPSFTTYYRKNHTFVKIFHGDTSRIRIGSLYLTGSSMHGVSESNLGMSIAEKTGEVFMFFKQSPILIPFALCYETPYSCEIKVTEDTLSKIDTLLPQGATNIVMTFGKANTNDLVLKADKIKGSKVSISQSGSVSFAVKIALGSNYVNTLLLDTVSAKISDSFSVQYLEMKNGAEVSAVSGFNIINIDYTTWKAREFPDFQKELILNCTLQSLTFTANGWSIESKEFLQSKYPALKFNFQTISPILEVNSGVTSIKKTTITSKSKLATIGANWNSIDSSSPVVDFISENFDQMTVTAKSYPFTAIPKLMNAGKVQLDTSVLPYTVSQPVTFNGVKTVVDFSNTESDPSKAHLNFESILMQQSSSIAAKGVGSGSYPISIKKLTTVNGAISNLTLCEVTNSIEAQYNTMLRGDFNTKDINIVLKWKINQMPQIDYESDPETNPNSVTIKFEEPSITGLENDYEKYLYQKTIKLVRLSQNQCQQWIQKAKFESSSVQCFGSKPVIEFKCSGNYLNLYGRNHIPGYDPDDDDDDDDGDAGNKKLSGGAVAGIVIFVLVLIAAAAAVAYYFFRKKNEYYMLNSQKLESYEGQQSKFIDGNQI